MIGKILIKNLEVKGKHGVLPEEALVENVFRINAELYVDLTAASKSDRVEDTVNYAEVVDCICKDMTQVSALLEHVSGRICSKILEKFPLVQGIDFRLEKMHPPMPRKMESVGVWMQLFREE